MTLTVTQIKNAKPKKKAYKLADEQALYLLITPNGSKLFNKSAKFVFMQDFLLVAIDGTKTYYYQMLAAVISYPEHHQVFPLIQRGGRSSTTSVSPFINDISVFTICFKMNMMLFLKLNRYNCERK